MRLWWQRSREREDRIREQQAHTDEELALMRSQLDQMLEIAASVGASVTSAASDAVDGVPVNLIFASRARIRRPGGEPVFMRGPRSGKEVIAVVGPYGNPAAWWSAIKARAGACQG